MNEIFIATARQEPGYWAVRILGLLDGQVQVADLAEAEGAARQLIVSTLNRPEDSVTVRVVVSERVRYQRDRIRLTNARAGRTSLAG